LPDGGADINSQEHSKYGRNHNMALEKGVTGDMTVAELLDRFPETAGVFIRRRMACVGCPLEGCRLRLPYSVAGFAAGIQPGRL